MNPYNVTGPTAAEVAQVESIVSQRLKGSFLWMVVGLLTTIGVGFAALVNPNWLRFAYQNFNIILLVELGVVFLFSARAYSANVMTLRGMFLSLIHISFAAALWMASRKIVTNCCTCMKAHKPLVLKSKRMPLWVP